MTLNHLKHKIWRKPRVFPASGGNNRGEDLFLKGSNWHDRVPLFQVKFGGKTQAFKAAVFPQTILNDRQVF